MLRRVEESGHFVIITGFPAASVTMFGLVQLSVAVAVDPQAPLWDRPRSKKAEAALSTDFRGPLTVTGT